MGYKVHISCSTQGGQYLGEKTEDQTRKVLSGRQSQTQIKIGCRAVINKKGPTDGFSDVLYSLIGFNCGCVVAMDIDQRTAPSMHLTEVVIQHQGSEWCYLKGGAYSTDKK